jgi:hypothetical protein
LQIVADGQNRPAEPFGDGADVHFLSVTELDDQAAARAEVIGRGREQAAHDDEAVAAAEERDGRFIGADFRLQRGLFAQRHVRRVRHDHVGRPVHAGQQVGLEEFHPPGDTVPGGIPPRDRKCLRRHVGGHHVDPGQRHRQRHRQASAPGADIDHAGHRRAAAGVLEHFLDDELGFGTWNQDVGGDFEVEAPELPVTDNHRDRLARGAADDQAVVPLGEVIGRRGAAPGNQRRPIPSEHVARQHLRVEPGAVFGNAGVEELSPAPGDAVVQGIHQRTFSPSVASFSFSELK